jgi:hypothetical protein
MTGAGAVGVSLLAGSLAIFSSSVADIVPWSWMDDMLLNVGAAVLLVVPIELFSARLRRRVAEVDERQTAAVNSVEASLTTRVDSLDERVESLADLNRLVSTDAKMRRDADRESFAALGADAPTREGVLRALQRATDRTLIASQGARVPVALRANLRLRFAVGDAGLIIGLEWIDGQPCRSWIWTLDKSAGDLFSEVAEAVESVGEPRPLDLEFAFQRLAAALTTADTIQAARPLLELFPPQWALTEHAIISTDQHEYEVTHARIDRIGMDRQVTGKPWLDHDSYDEAHLVARLLFPLTGRQEEAEARRQQHEQQWSGEF